MTAHIQYEDNSKPQWPRVITDVWCVQHIKNDLIILRELDDGGQEEFKLDMRELINVEIKLR